MYNPDLNRRHFLFGLASLGTLAIDQPAQGFDEARVLYNRNYQTAIGVGDEPLTFVDRFGQFKSDDANVPELANAARGGGSRNVTAFVYVGDPLQPVSSFSASQRLDEGYLPVVLTNLRTGTGEFQSLAFSSSAPVQADYLGITSGRNAFRIRLLCAATTATTMEGGVVRTPARILAVVPAPSGVKIRLLLTLTIPPNAVRVWPDVYSRTLNRICVLFGYVCPPTITQRR
jgi:hypothetical protein